MKSFGRLRLFVSLLAFALSAAIVQPALAADRIAFGDAVWNVTCPLSHSAMNDPIVFPGLAGASHLHRFYANNSTDEATTTNSLAAATSTCLRGMDDADHSAYWVPALMQSVNGAAPTPVAATATNSRIAAYYTLGGDTAPVQPFPYGLRMIAGNAKATAPQDLGVAHYQCEKSGVQTPASASIPTCTDGTHLKGEVTFPNCWDGKNLDSADHASHMAYEVKHACPADHPVKVPQLHVMAHWDLTATGIGSSYSLASGSANSLHADFWNVWNPPVQQWLVTNCLNAHRNCTGIQRTEISAKSVPFPQIKEPVRTAPLPTPMSPDMPMTGMPGMTPAASPKPASAVLTAVTTTPASLPVTGGLAGGGVGLGAIGLAGYHYLKSRKLVQNARRK